MRRVQRQAARDALGEPGCTPYAPAPQVTLVAHGDDGLDALYRVVSMLRAEAIEIVSLETARTREAGVARFTIVVDPARADPRRVAACLRRAPVIRDVEELVPSRILRRDLAVVKVRDTATDAFRLDCLMAFDAVSRVSETDSCIIVEARGEPMEVDDVLLALQDAGVIEVIRLTAVMGTDDRPSLVAPRGAVRRMRPAQP